MYVLGNSFVDEKAVLLASAGKNIVLIPFGQKTLVGGHRSGFSPKQKGATSRVKMAYPRIEEMLHGPEGLGGHGIDAERRYLLNAPVHDKEVFHLEGASDVALKLYLLETRVDGCDP